MKTSCSRSLALSLSLSLTLALVYNSCACVIYVYTHTHMYFFPSLYPNLPICPSILLAVCVATDKAYQPLCIYRTYLSTYRPDYLRLPRSLQRGP